MKISQSFVKEYSKYKQKKACGLQVKAKYIDGIKFPSTPTMELGNYFEFMATGSLPRSGNVPTPEMVYKGTAKERLATDYERANESAEFFKTVVEKYKIEILETGKSITIDNRTGILDIVAKFNNRLCVIDLKYSGLLDDKWNEMGWETESLPYKDNLMIQAVHYTTLLAEVCEVGYSDIDFYFFVFDSKNSSNAKIIKVNIDPDAYESHLQVIDKVYEEVVLNNHNFRAYPSLKLCNTCPIANDCKHKIDVPNVEEIYYTI
jgi:hypothetical protein